jgi:hypothetical protein
MLRTIGGLLAGIIVAFATIWAIELASHQIYGAPSGVDPRDREAVAAVIRGMETGALGLVVFAWFGGALVGGVVAGLIALRRWAAWTVAGVVALASILNILFYPHPDWMQVMAFIAPALGGLVAGHFTAARAARRPAGSATDG